jgi:CelD/BcsL family acetyltransferase involved in cellulose biosynthesis
MSVALEASSAELGAVIPEWEDLAERTGAAPFLRAGWVTAWWSAFGAGKLEVRVVRWRADGRLAALLPVWLAHGTLASPTNWHTPEFGLLAESEVAAHTLLGALLAERRRRVALAFLGPEPAASFAQEAAGRGYRVLRRTLQRSPWLPIDGDWPTYERGLSKKLRADLERKRKRLAARGRVSLEVSAGERLDERLEQGLAVEASGWKGARGTAIRSRPASRRFYGEIARWAAERGWLRLAFLRLDGRAVAFDFCLEHGGIHYLLKTGFDPAWREADPGKLLRHAMIARAFREGLRAYELLGTDEPWKLRWTRSTRPRELVQAFAPSPMGRLDWTLHALARPLVKRVRDLVRGRSSRTGEPRAQPTLPAGSLSGPAFGSGEP